jgi:hypothetical protein
MMTSIVPISRIKVLGSTIYGFPGTRDNKFRNASPASVIRIRFRSG